MSSKMAWLVIQSVGEGERFGKLTGAHQEAGAVDSPLAF